MSQTFYWHDYETFGRNPRRDRPVQFAGIRTDAELNIIEQPLNILAKPTLDCLPDPGACLITGITPQQAQQTGVLEIEFCEQINAQLSRPGTCGVGYNSIAFDDEVTRHLLYRNLMDPYSREWRNGNSRWDIINVVRLCYALRPDGINWPLKENGAPSFRLEELATANQLNHENAHDALSDVHVTIDLARLIKKTQPRLFDYCLKLRAKKFVDTLLNLDTKQIVIHVSSKFPAFNGCLSPIIPLAKDINNNNQYICYDLRHNPEALLTEDVDTLKERLFTPSSDLPEGIERIALKGIAINKSPILCPTGVLKGADLDRIELDMEKCEQHANIIREFPGIAEKVQAIFERDFDESIDHDPDNELYSGAFIPAADRQQLNALLDLDPASFNSSDYSFEDPRLEEMLFRFRARNYPESLGLEEQNRWEETRLRILNDPDLGCSTSLLDYEGLLAQYKSEYPEKSALWDSLSDWYQHVKQS